MKSIAFLPSLSSATVCISQKWSKTIHSGIQGSFVSGSSKHQPLLLTFRVYLGLCCGRIAPCPLGLTPGLAKVCHGAWFLATFLHAKLHWFILRGAGFTAVGRQVFLMAVARVKAPQSSEFPRFEMENQAMAWCSDT